MSIEAPLFSDPRTMTQLAANFTEYYSRDGVPQPDEATEHRVKAVFRAKGDNLTMYAWPTHFDMEKSAEFAIATCWAQLVAAHRVICEQHPGARMYPDIHPTLTVERWHDGDSTNISVSTVVSWWAPKPVETVCS